MKWFTHHSITVAAALALNLPPAGVAGALLGSVLPDVIDQRLARLAPNPQRAFNQIHRGASHWFGWYAVLLLSALAVEPSLLPRDMGSLALRAKALSTAAGLAFGGLCHVALDMLTPQGVPLHPLSRKNKVSLHLCSTGSLGEYLFLAVGLGAIALLAPGRWPDIMRAVQKFL